MLDSIILILKFDRSAPMSVGFLRTPMSISARAGPFWVLFIHSTETIMLMEDVHRKLTVGSQ